MKQLIKLLQTNQEDLAGLILNSKLIKSNKVITDFTNYIIVNPKNKVALCSHLDIVGNNTPKKITIKKYGNNLILSANNSILGGDDKTGVWIMLQLLKLDYPYCYMFFLNEEKGCIGSNNLCYDQPIDLNFYNCFVGLDRHGKSDVATYGQNNPQLISAFKKYGYRQAFGSCTDCSVLARHSKVACVNLSVGFYNEHTKKELVLFNDTIKTFNVFKSKKLFNLLNSKQFFSKNVFN